MTIKQRLTYYTKELLSWNGEPGEETDLPTEKAKFVALVVIADVIQEGFQNLAKALERTDGEER